MGRKKKKSNAAPQAAAASPFARSSNEARPRPLPKWLLAAVIALLCVHFTLAVSSTWNKSPTFDEPFHFTAGWSIWLTGDYRMATSPFLPAIWATVPLVHGKLVSPRLDTALWYESNRFGLARQFFYGAGNKTQDMLRRGRAMIALFSVAIGLAVFFVSRKLFGDYGGLLSLTLYTFSPSILAHAALTTADLMAAGFYLFSATAAWWACRHITLRSLCISSLALAGLFLSKTGSFLILPVLWAMILIRALAREPLPVRLPWREQTLETRGAILKALLAVAAAQCLIVYVCIWTAFGFSYSTFKVNRHPSERLLIAHTQFHGMDPWEVQYRELPQLKSTIEFARRHRLLPEIYLYSVAFGAQSARMRYSFLDGEYSLTGFRSFFPRCFLYKTPPALMALLLCALAASLLRWRPPPGDDSGATFARNAGHALYETAPLWLLAAIYWISVIPSQLNIGERHLLPTMPPLFILAGAAAGLLDHRLIFVRWLAPALALGVVISSLKIYPHYLAYFNAFAGGPSNGYRRLVDSSLDWGQDLIGLQRWLAANAGDRPVFLAYFGNAPPPYYGIRAYELPYETLALGKARRIGLPRLEPGLYCISATRLQQLYPPDILGWNPEDEKRYQTLYPQMREFEAIPLDDDEALRSRVSRKGREFENSFNLFQRLRFARLCEYLKRRAPDAHIGYSILIYDLDSNALTEALTPPPSKETSDAAE